MPSSNEGEEPRKKQKLWPSLTVSSNGQRDEEPPLSSGEEEEPRKRQKPANLPARQKRWANRVAPTRMRTRSMSPEHISLANERGLIKVWFAKRDEYFPLHRKYYQRNTVSLLRPVRSHVSNHAQPWVDLYRISVRSRQQGPRVQPGLASQPVPNRMPAPPPPRPKMWFGSKVEAQERLETNNGTRKRQSGSMAA